MKRIILLVVSIVVLLQLSACSFIDFKAFIDDDDYEDLDDEGDGIGYVDPIPIVTEPEYKYTGRDSIFYDNTQTVYSYLSSTQYLSIVHAVMQAETLRDPVGYTLQIKNGRTEQSSGNLVGFLHWQELPYNSLKTCFSDKSLYTFAQNGQIPRLSDKGPLGLLFEDEVIDPDNLNIIITDMMENNFGASQIAAELSKTITLRQGLQITLYGFKSDDFSGNMSFPSYSTVGGVVKTVKNYRGQAAMYVLVVGPTSEVEAFDSRFQAQLTGDVKVYKTSYYNGEDYPGETWLGNFELIESLGRKITNGNAETLNYTVNAKTNEDGAGLIYDKANTSKGYREAVQIAFSAPLAENSIFKSGGLEAANIKVWKINKDGGEEEYFGMDIRAMLETYKKSLTAWKNGVKRTEPLNDIIIGDGVYLGLYIPNMPEGRYRIELQIVADMARGDWIESFSASVYEYQSLNTILPTSPDNPNHYIWQAGATDILSRTLDLADVDRILRTEIETTKVVQEIQIEITR